METLKKHWVLMLVVAVVGGVALVFAMRKNATVAKAVNAVLPAVTTSPTI